MFAYNPQVQDQSGQILGQYQTQAAKTQAESQAALGQNIGKGLESIGSSIAGGITKSRENAIKYDTAAGMLETYKQNAGALGLDLNMLGGMEAKYAKDPDKLIGALTVVGKMAENNMALEKSIAIADAYGANNKDLAMWKADRATENAAAKEPKLDANYARQAYQSIRGKGYSHEQAIEGMKASGMNWGVPYIERPDPMWGQQ